MSIRSILLPLLLALTMPFWASSASAQVVHLRSDVCHAVASADTPATASAVSRLSFSCGGAPDQSSYGDRWVWLKLRATARIGAMPAGWNLQIDQSRFEGLVVLVVARDGTVQRETITPASIDGHAALGGMLRVRIARPGAQIEALYVGWDRIDDLSLMRKLSAATPSAAMSVDHRWLGLMGVFAGAILSALAYNLLIYTGQRLVFQRWYLAWSAMALAYGLCWTNAAALLVPGLAGPVAVTIDYLLVSGLIASGSLFFLSVLEDGILPRWLIRCGWSCAGISVMAGVMAATHPVLAPITFDLVLNVAFVINALCLATGVVTAIRGRSRVVWFYLAGWTPVLMVFALRVSRNFGLAVQDDIVDMSTFAALAFESVALSLAIADRFRRLGKERDGAQHARRAIEIENETFRRAAQTDFLTGLGNRAAFQAELRELCETGKPFMLLLIDVDHLKAINDRLGHDGGDVLLENVGKGLVRAAGQRGHVSRIGGDEFAILLGGTGCERLRIRQTLDELQGRKMSHEGRSWSLSLSIGFARFPEDAGDAELLVKNADLALYHAKESGRRRQYDYAPPLRAGLERRQTFSREAEQAMEKGEFALHYQPIVDLQTGTAHSCEALLRWQHPEHGLMTPALFGDMLNERETGLVVQQHVLDLALGNLRDQPDLLTRISVNLTAAQLDGRHAAARLLARLQAYGIAPQRLCIEVTEDFVLDRNINETADALRLLHDAGVTIALDDFGTGYASLIHLKHLPFDMLKIDRSFTLSLFEDDGQSEEIIRAIIGLGQGLRKMVVAEGVETEAQRRRLAEMGCEFGQGYLFARPQPIEAMAAEAASGIAA